MGIDRFRLTAYESITTYGYGRSYLTERSLTLIYTAGKRVE